MGGRVAHVRAVFAGGAGGPRTAPGRSTPGRRAGRGIATTMVVMLGALAPGATEAQTTIPVPPAFAADADLEGVRRAAQDYLDGFYEGDEAKLRRSVHPDVDKFGFERPAPDQEYRRYAMSYEQMFSFAASVRAGRNLPPAGAPREVIPLDVQDQTAVVKVVAWWGQDYLQMARYDGTWMIVHVLWQALTP